MASLVVGRLKALGRRRRSRSLRQLRLSRMATSPLGSGIDLRHTPLTTLLTGLRFFCTAAVVCFAHAALEFRAVRYEVSLDVSVLRDIPAPLMRSLRLSLSSLADLSISDTHASNAMQHPARTMYSHPAALEDLIRSIYIRATGDGMTGNCRHSYDIRRTKGQAPRPQARTSIRLGRISTASDCPGL